MGEQIVQAIFNRFVATAAIAFAIHAAPFARAEEVLFDIDLSRGAAALTPAAGAATVLGGEWNEGWRVTAHNQRIILDAGRTLKNGLAEVWFTKQGSPLNADGVKGQWLSLHETDGNLSPEYVELRAGAEAYGFSKLRAKSNEMGFSSKLKKVTHKRCEVKSGKIEDWVTDDKTIMHASIRWQDGVVSFTTPGSPACPCTKYFQFEAPYIIDSLRYLYLGSDETEAGGSLPGLRFKRVRFVDLAGTAKK